MGNGTVRHLPFESGPTARTSLVEIKKLFSDEKSVLIVSEMSGKKDLKKKLRNHVNQSSLGSPSFDS